MWGKFGHVTPRKPGPNETFVVHRVVPLSGHERFRGGLVFEADRLLYHSTLGLRVIKKKRHGGCTAEAFSSKASLSSDHFWRTTFGITDHLGDAPDHDSDLRAKLTDFCKVDEFLQS